MHKTWWILLIVAVAGSGALRQRLGDVKPPPTALQSHYARWQALGFTHYRYSLMILCRCGFTRQPYTFEVREGKLMSATDGAGHPISGVDINAPPQSVDWFFGLSTMDSLFKHIEQTGDQAANVDTSYDWHYAYPVFTLVDWKGGELGDEIGLYVTDFEVLP